MKLHDWLIYSKLHPSYNCFVDCSNNLVQIDNNNNTQLHHLQIDQRSQHKSYPDKMLDNTIKTGSIKNYVVDNTIF